MASTDAIVNVITSPTFASVFVALLDMSVKVDSTGQVTSLTNLRSLRAAIVSS